MEFLRSTLNWFGNFAGGIFEDMQRQVYYRTGHTGAFGVILLLFKKWYLIVMIPAVTALYWILKAFDDMGILTGVENFVSGHLNSVVDVAHYCTPKILNKAAFLECLNDPKQ